MGIKTVLKFLIDYGKKYQQIRKPSVQKQLLDEWLVRTLAEKIGEDDIKFEYGELTKRIQNCGFGITQNTKKTLNIIEIEGEYCDVFVCVIQLITNSPRIRAMF